MPPRKTVQFEIKGLKEVAEGLRDFTEATAKNTVRRALLQAAEPMAKQARANAPRDSGNLREAIEVSTKADRTGGRLRNRNLKFVFVGPSYSRFDPNYAPYAHLVEFGTAARYHADGKFVGSVPAQPFLRPAFDTQRQTVVLKFKDFLAVEITETAERAARKSKKAAA